MKASFSIHAPLEAPLQELPISAWTALSLQLWKYITKHEGSQKALEFLQTLPEDLRKTSHVFRAVEASRKALGIAPEVVAAPDVAALDLSKIAAVVPITEVVATTGVKEKYDVVIWTGGAWERWSPDQVGAQGIGGSETAAYQMGRELVKLGHKVRIYADTDKPGFYNDVEFRSYAQAVENPSSLACDIFISSRQPWAFDFNFTAKLKLLWVHDVHVGSPNEGLDAQLAKVDKILCLSRWHKNLLQQTYRNVPEDKFLLTRNGIDLDRYKSEPEKIGNRLIYSSSANRGLEVALELFPNIRRNVPDAELHLYYGFDTWRAFASLHAPHELAEIERIRKSIEETPGVVSHGRVGQDELAAAQLAAKVWFYPTWFTETSCISAMEAQAAGCVPVTSALAALTETVHHGILIEGSNRDLSYQREAVEATVRLLKDEGYRNRFAIEGRAEALRRHSWAGVAAEWVEAFKSVLQPSSSLSVEGTKPETVVDKPAPEVDRVVKNVRVKPLRIAIILGKTGSSVHGTLDIQNIFTTDATFVTGTVAGFVGLAWGLAERGHSVDAFCDCREDVVHSPHGGAHFYRLDHNKISDDYDACISINEPDVLRQFANGLKICVTWLNDFNFCMPGFELVPDVYIAPSQALLDHLVHTTLAPQGRMGPVIPISVNLEFYSKAVARRPFSMAYCSSPDRGLHWLLEWFPEIRAQVPQATLDIYYRYKPWRDQLVGNPAYAGTENRRRAEIIHAGLSCLGENGENGVTLIGPVPPRRLIDALRATQVLAYPCDTLCWSEGFSVSIMDASAAGCVPIISGVDALGEVYGGAAHIVPGRPGDHNKQEWIDAIVLALTNPDFASEVRLTARRHAQKFSRQKVAVQWETFLRERLKGAMT